MYPNTPCHWMYTYIPVYVWPLLWCTCCNNLDIIWHMRTPRNEFYASPERSPKQTVSQMLVINFYETHPLCCFSADTWCSSVLKHTLRTNIVNLHVFHTFPWIFFGIAELEQIFTFCEQNVGHMTKSRQTCQEGWKCTKTWKSHRAKIRRARVPGPKESNLSCAPGPEEHVKFI